MASVSYQTFSSSSTRRDSIRFPNHLDNPNFANPRFLPQPRLHRAHESSVCRCSSRSPSESEGRRWDLAVQDAFRNVIERIDGYLHSHRNRDKGVERGGDGVAETESWAAADDEIGWDWERWTKHFEDVDSQERILSVLKSQLEAAVRGEEYVDAARLKVAIAAVSTSDTVGKVMALLEKAIEEEEYDEAAFMRDSAGTGLVGWWNGISEDATDPYGRIIRITAEHGRYVATSYSARQLATSAPGAPLFEIFLTIDKEGKYKQQAVYLKRKVVSQEFVPIRSMLPIHSASGSLRKLGSPDDKSDPLGLDAEDSDNRDDDSDVVDKLPGFQNFVKDMIPGVRIKVLKVTAPEKVDRDLISKVIEQIMEEEEDEDEDEDGENSKDFEEDFEIHNDEDGNKVKANVGKNDTPTEPDIDLTRNEEEGQMAMKFLFGGLAQKLSSNVRPKDDLLRVPAKLEKKGRTSFSFLIEKEVDELEIGRKGKMALDQKLNLSGPISTDNVMLDFTKLMGKERISVKALRDIGEFINNSINQARNQQPLSGSTTFNRIDLPAYPDPLNGLYVGSNGLYSSEVIHLRRKVGQFQEDRNTQKPSNLEFYEYVEALKLTGDPHVPAGQVAFRAKVGKRYQLPHKGIIPEEFGVVVRYKGQGRLAEAGFRNPRWVDGELVILDGKFIKGGPAVGFVYWAPEYHFSRLRLQD
uniref:Protein EXECUTER 1, chloroplastic n=1 Tax=Kalanchoe fedtschenkoi TaxID=63787 RepID=A0A7N1A2G9_KALFE